MRTLLLILAILLSGCSVTTPSMTHYRIDPNMQIKPSQVPMQKYSVKVIPIFSNSSLSNNAMHYRVGEYKEYTYTQASWVESPNRAVANRLTQALADSKLFNGVYSYKSINKGDLVLEVDLGEFIQSFDEQNKTSSVKAAMHLHLIERDSGKLIASKNFVKTLQSKTLDAKGGVAGLNMVLGEMMEETVAWLGENIQ